MTLKKRLNTRTTVAAKFKKGQKLVCFHYKDMPTVTIDSVNGDEIWVKEANGKTWWGPREWFKVSARLKTKKAVKKSNLCDESIPGCTCNQVSSVSQYRG